MSDWSDGIQAVRPAMAARLFRAMAAVWEAVLRSIGIVLGTCKAGRARVAEHAGYLMQIDEKLLSQRELLQ